ncbi:MAG: ketoacyl-ACP synthase III [Planctomycetes bacterium]|nr:ketoacyl-ACP synthase III [Planctomycetota bacterium]
MLHSQIGPIAVHLPERVETNEELQAMNPDWDLSLIAEKTGIYSRRIAAPDETASDLAVNACEKLFRENNIDRSTIDYILLCTQTPDYPLPTTACLIQDRLGLPIHCGAIDFNLGCSGYVYGLSIAEGLIASGQCKKILLVTAETYSKYIQTDDRSIRPIFSDAAAATLIEAQEERALHGFVFGTDGSGANTLIVADGGARSASCAIRPRNRKRWGSRLYMDGPSLMSFTVGAIPQMVREMVSSAGMSLQNIHLFLMHQATRKMLEHLQVALQTDEEHLPIRLSERGNTVSCTLPILIDDLRKEGRIPPGTQSVLVGFGVGWSWAGCLWKS